jgi:hypothetical protein
MASTDRASMGGVRSLRAMFENQNQNQNQNQEPSTPDHRGRSPASNSFGTNGDSARPLSKVRTSFVPVDGFLTNGLKSAATSQEREPLTNGKSECTPPTMLDEFQCKLYSMAGRLLLYSLEEPRI